MKTPKNRTSADRHFKHFCISLAVFFGMAFLLGTLCPDGNTEGIDKDVRFLLGVFGGIILLSILVFGFLAISSFLRHRK